VASGATLTNASYGELLKTIATHPWNLFTGIWKTHSSFWANISSSGVLGIVWPPTLIAIVAVLGQSAFSPIFVVPGLQNVAVYGLIPVGSVAVSLWMLDRRPRLGFAVMAVLAVNTAIWGIMWFPRVSTNWAPITPGAVSELSRIEKLIGPNDEVVASQGVSGVFADRPSAYAIMTSGKTMQVTPGRKVWFVITPFDGIETTDASISVELIQRLAQTPGVHMRIDHDSVWLFEWTPPAGVHKFVLAPISALVAPPWTLPGVSGKVVKKGSNTSNWYVTNTGAPGYVFDRALWRVPAGHYTASVTLSASATTDVEVWDTTKSQLLKRIVVSNTHGRAHLSLPVVMAQTGHQPFVGGSLLWAINPVMNIGDSLEIRVWTAGKAGSVSVYKASLHGGRS
jgi:hypothetical protein